MIATAISELLVPSVSLLDEVGFLASGSVDELGAAIANGFGALGHAVRRRVLALLADRGVSNRSEIAEELATDPAVSAEEADRLNVSLHHNHLPKLDDCGYVEYDVRSGDVALWRAPEEVESELESR